MLPSHPAMYAQSPHVVTPATSNPARYMLNLLGDVEPALHTPHMRHKGIQDKSGEGPTPRISGPTKARTYLSKKNMIEVDFALGELASSLSSVRALDNAINNSEIIVPAFRNRLDKVRRWLYADRKWLTHHKAKCMEEGVTVALSTAYDTIQKSNAEIRYIMAECSKAMEQSSLPDLAKGFRVVQLCASGPVFA